MSAILAPQVHCKSVAEVRLCSVSFDDVLDVGELLTGSVTTTVSPAGLTIANEAVSTAILTINGCDVAIGRAIQFKASGGTTMTEYTVTITVSTDSTPAQTLQGEVTLEVI